MWDAKKVTSTPKEDNLDSKQFQIKNNALVQEFASLGARAGNTAYHVLNNQQPLLPSHFISAFGES